MKQSISFLLFVMLIILVASHTAAAQYRTKKNKVEHRFNAGILLGGNLSQVDGDLYTGFDKAGLRGGLKGSMYLNQRLDVLVGFLYNQKGSRFEGPRGSITANDKARRIHFDYIEVPFLLAIELGDELRDGKGYVLETGFSFARLVNYQITEEVIDPERMVNYNAYAKDFNPNEFNFLLGTTYYINAHFGIGINYTLQINKVFNNPQERDLSLSGRFRNDPYTRVALLRNYQLSLQLVYNVF